MPVVRPCVERLPNGVGCPEYALPGKSRCAAHHAEAMKNRQVSAGTTAEWRWARKQELDRDGSRCTRCGKTQEQAKAESPTGKGLEVHHVESGSFRERHHDLDLLQTLCPPCHRAVRGKKKKSRLSLEEWKAQAVERGRARRGR